MVQGAGITEWPVVRDCGIGQVATSGRGGGSACADVWWAHAHACADVWFAAHGPCLVAGGVLGVRRFSLMLACPSWAPLPQPTQIKGVINCPEIVETWRILGQFDPGQCILACLVSV